MKKFTSTLEGLFLVALLVATGLVLAAAWGGALKLKQTVAENASIMHIDTSALSDVEHMRAIADSMIQDSRAYFLMGSKSILDKQQTEKNDFTTALNAFDKKSPQTHELIKKIVDLKAQEADFFKQGEDFRNKNTESKIVGQFYQSKTNPILAQINGALDQITKFHNAALAETRANAAEAGVRAQSLIPESMSALTSAISIIALCFALLVIRVLASRAKVLRQRSRLVDEAKAATIARDEAISAFTQDFKEPLTSLSALADQMQSKDQADVVRSTVAEMHSLMADIYDQTKATNGGLFLRLEQLGVADILDDAQSFLQPLARQKEITLQFDAVNATVLAYVDRERVMRVLSNLIGNAIKFSPRHSRVTVKVKSDAQWANILILDSAPRIPESQLPLIFDSTWQARKTAELGAGIGLTVVKTIIEAHGGTVKVEHNLQGGNTFTFSLPRRRPANAQLKKPASSGVRKMARAPEANPFGVNDGPTQ